MRLPQEEYEQIRQAWEEWVTGLAEWHLFGGLTFDPKRPRYSPPPGPQRQEGHTLHSPRLDDAGVVRLTSSPRGRESAIAAATRFFANSERRIKRRITGVVALEYHKNGWPHFHPLLHLEGGLMNGDVKALGQIWYQACGYGRLEMPTSVNDVAAYASKYLVKQLERGDVLIWPKKGPILRPERRRLVADASGGQRP